MTIWPLTKMINKRTKKTNHLHFVIISPILFLQYVLHPVFISIKIITNKRTDKSDHSHFAIVSLSFFFKILHPVFTSIKIITNKRTDKTDHSHFAIAHLKHCDYHHTYGNGSGPPNSWTVIDHFPCGTLSFPQSVCVLSC